MSSPITSAIQATAVLSVVMWTKVVVTNLGLGGAKTDAGARPKEDSYQRGAEEVTQEALDAKDRAQRIVNNDLENIPYTIALAWGAMLCIYLSEDTDKRERQAISHVVLYALFVAARIMHTVAFSKGLSITRSVYYLVGLLASFGITINGTIAAFRIKDME